MPAHRPFAPLLAVMLMAAPSALLMTGGPPAQAQGPVQPPRGHGDAQAEAFVQEQASKVLEVLNNRSITLTEKKATFRALVEQVADVPRITRFVLGRYSRTLTPSQYDAFAAAFRAYAENVYESRLGEYRGQTLRVVGSIVRRPGDVVVESEIVGAKGETPMVNWRIMRGPDGAYRAVDVEVSGVWLAITEQQDFVSTLDNHHGDVNLLIDQLKRDVAAKPTGARS